ncbi:ferritin-like-domain-containing protein [Jimgerdemannia flammicorona]|uniref:Ferritin-like-domain-containing protein n=1 Tax=Jimgerdemannia flammicorona TaxID=994334 RepID=A0A433BIC0_9FUNG|nr:ferritin-like-domain-containing protein [Jimgerdemannia flammicorona]
MLQLSGNGGDAINGDPQRWMSLTQLQYERMKKWAMGYFEAGETSEKKETSEKNEHSKTLGLLTKAALEMATGSPFYPGIEISHNAQDPDTYQDSKIPENAFRFSTNAFRFSTNAFRFSTNAFRFSTKFKPGDITRSLSLPWHSDFYECNEHWWPATRPDDVVPEEKYKDTKFGDLQREKWHRGLRSTDNTDLDAGNYDGNTDMGPARFHCGERRLFEVIKKALSNLLEDIKAIKIGVSLDNRETVEHPLLQDAEKELSELLSELPNPYVLSGDTENDLSNLLEAIKKVNIRDLLETNKDGKVDAEDAYLSQRASEIIRSSVVRITKTLNDGDDSSEIDRLFKAIETIFSHVRSTIHTYALELFRYILVVLIFVIRAIEKNRSKVKEIVERIFDDLVKEILVDHLQFAMQIELITIPLYLYAMYSINPECEEVEKKAREAENAVEAGDTTDEAKENAKEARKNADDAKKNTKLAKQVFRSVVSQEMLHLSLAGNVLLAIGGQPKLYDRDIIPRFPELLPYRESPLELNLRPATKGHIRDIFMEQSLTDKCHSIHAVREIGIREVEHNATTWEAPVIPYKSISLFYEYIKIGLLMKQFHNDPRIGCQFAPDQSEYASPHANPSKDGLVVVTDYATATKAIEIIVTQGEGHLCHKDPSNPSHYDMFNDLVYCPGRSWVTFNIQDSPRTRDYGDEKIKTVRAFQCSLVCLDSQTNLNPMPIFLAHTAFIGIRCDILLPL